MGFRAIILPIPQRCRQLVGGLWQLIRADERRFFVERLWIPYRGCSGSSIDPMGGYMSMSEDKKFMRRAIELALLAEGEGNLPVGTVIALAGEVVAEGRNAMWVPQFDATRHAEIEALRAVRADLWDSSAEMTLYTSLEPCLMCFGR
jgi:deoxycytidylate deaminase